MLRAIDGATPETLRWYRDGVRDGRFYAMGFYDRARLACVAVIAFNDGAAGRELLVMAAAGGAVGVDLTSTVLLGLEPLACADGCARMRFETRRPGLVKRTALIGYTFGCVVMEKELRPCAA